MVRMRTVRELGNPRVENGIVMCNYCDDDEGTCVISYPGGHSAPACIDCAEAIIAIGDRVTEILPRVFLCRQGKKKIIVTLAERSKVGP